MPTKTLLLIQLFASLLCASQIQEPKEKIFKEDAYMPCPVLLKNIEALQRYKAQEAESNYQTSEKVLLFLLSGVIYIGDFRVKPKDVNIDDAIAELQERLKTCEPY